MLHDDLNKWTRASYKKVQETLARARHARNNTMNILHGKDIDELDIAIRMKKINTVDDFLKEF